MSGFYEYYSERQRYEDMASQAEQERLIQQLEAEQGRSSRFQQLVAKFQKSGRRDEQKEPSSTRVKTLRPLSQGR